MTTRLPCTIAFGILLLLTGCKFDLTEVRPDMGRDPRRGYFGLTLDVFEREGPLRIQAVLHPGEDEESVIHPLADDSLRLDGVPVAPYDTTPSGIRFYRIDNLEADAGLRTLTLPSIPGTHEPIPQVVAEPLLVDAPDTIVVARSGTIRLRMLGLGDPSDPDAGTWGLRFGRGCTTGEIFTLSGRTAPQPLLEVPVSLLPGDITEFNLLYYGGMSHSPEKPDFAYEVRIQREFSVCLPVRIEG